MTCPRCGYGNHSVAKCPEVREEYHGVPRDHFDEEDEEDSGVTLRDGESRDDSAHARRNAAMLRMAKAEMEGEDHE